MRRIAIPLTLSILVLGLALAPGQASLVPAPDDPPPQLLSSSQFVRRPAKIDPRWTEQISRIPGVRRFRILEVSLPSTLPHSIDRMAVEFFPDVRFTAETKRVRVRGLTHFSWSGAIPQDPGGRISFTFRDGKVAGWALVHGSCYRAMNLAPNVYGLLEMDRQPTSAATPAKTPSEVKS